ncbi:TPA: hypothetical protein ACPJ09_004663 [Vibrio diabolicus]|uniref:hypothetical protein n=1 Tax=Vibrio alginolyticus TaxID=663 RepID=UPI002FF0687B
MNGSRIEAFRAAARELSDYEVIEALHNRLEHEQESIDDRSAGIIRQILGDPTKPLSRNQQYHYDNFILPTLVEGCGITGCSKFTVAGRDYCGVCALEYGE